MSVITRDEWGAGPQRAETIPLPVQRLYLHHSVTPEWLGAEAARNLQDIARARGFLDISYSWLVDVAGNQIEGRGWGRAGAHTVGWNSTSHAICLVGNFQDKVPPDAMLNGAARLVRKHARVGPDRITHGHRDVASTACPGDRAYTRIDDINRLAQEDDMPTLDEIRGVIEEVLSDPDSPAVKVLATQTKNRILESFAHPDSEQAVAARQRIAREVTNRVRADLNLEGHDVESVNLFTAVFRAAQHAHGAHMAAGEVLAFLQAQFPDTPEPAEPM
jgi:hypothetical protein